MRCVEPVWRFDISKHVMARNVQTVAGFVRPRERDPETKRLLCSFRSMTVVRHVLSLIGETPALSIAFRG